MCRAGGSAAGEDSDLEEGCERCQALPQGARWKLCLLHTPGGPTHMPCAVSLARAATAELRARQFRARLPGVCQRATFSLTRETPSTWQTGSHGHRATEEAAELP